MPNGSLPAIPGAPEEATTAIKSPGTNQSDESSRSEKRGTGSSHAAADAAHGDRPARLDPAQVTINPAENILVLHPGDTTSETVVVTIPPTPNGIEHVSLVATGATAPFVTSITPAAGFGPLPPNAP